MLRPGGRLHSTVSNYASMDKRLHFLLYGSLVKNINLTRHLQTTTDSEANVRHHLFYPQLHHILVGEGFAVTDLRAASVRTKDRFLTPLAWWVWLMTWVIPRRRWKRDRIRETRSRAISPGGKYLYVEAVKAGCR